MIQAVGIFVDCTHLLPAMSDSLQSACVQAEATRQAGKLAARAATNAGWLQAISVVGAAVIAAFALDGWLNEARGRRRLALAEEAYVLGQDAISRTREIRAAFMTAHEMGGIPGADAALDGYRKRVDSADSAVREFIPVYQRARVYCDLPDPGPPATVRRNTILLWMFAQNMVQLEHQQKDANERLIREHAASVERFFGPKYGTGEPDGIELELREASRILDRVLLPLFKKQPSLGRKLVSKAHEYRGRLWKWALQIQPAVGRANGGANTE